jgi:dihydrofolate reductase
MLISLIVAMDQNRAIGRGGGIPWRLSADLQHFKRLTMGHHLIQGRRTWDSIGRPLPGREMIVVTRQPGYRVPAGVAVAPSLDAALKIARARGETEAFIGGGAALYAEALPLADRIHLTRVDASIQGADTFFPEFDETEWQVMEQWRQEAGERNEYAFTFETLKRSNV